MCDLHKFGRSLYEFHPIIKKYVEKYILKNITNISQKIITLTRIELDKILS